MRRLGIISCLILLWLVLCMLFLTGCQMSAVGNAAVAAEYTFFEKLYLFVSTDYGEFCALVACLMATHLTFLLQRYLVPRLQIYAPKAAEALRSVCKKAEGALKALLRKATTPPDTEDDPSNTKNVSDTEDTPPTDHTP